MKKITVEIITPMGVEFKKECTTVQFNVADDAKGGYGGSYGVRAGHAKAIFALKKGLVKVLSGTELILNCNCGDGFATVDENAVSLVVESFDEA